MNDSVEENINIPSTGSAGVGFTSTPTGGNKKGGSSKGRTRRRNRSGKGFQGRPSQSNPATGKIPTQFSGEIGSTSISRLSEIHQTTNGELLCRTAYEHVKFSPLGEPGTLVHSIVSQELREMRNAIRWNNVDYSAPSGIQLDIRIEKLDEYLEMCITYIHCYKTLVILRQLSRDFVDNGEKQLIGYAVEQLMDLRGVNPLISLAESKIREMSIPPNILLVHDQLFGLKECPESNSERRFIWLGMQIPLNFENYKVAGLVTSYESRGKKSAFETCYEDYSDEISYPVDERYGYDPRSVMLAPPVTSRDIQTLRAVLVNFEEWSNQPDGVYQNFSRLFRIVKPEWQLKGYEYEYKSIPMADQAWVNYVENLSILAPSSSHNALGMGWSNEVIQPGALLTYTKPKGMIYPFFYLFLSWSTEVYSDEYASASGLESQYDGGSSGYCLPIPNDEGNFGMPYPGFIGKIATRNQVENELVRCQRVGILRNGKPFSISKLEHSNTLGFRYFISRNDDSTRVYRNVRVGDEIMQISKRTIEQNIRSFVSWYLCTSDFKGSDVFISNTRSDNK